MKIKVTEMFRWAAEDIERFIALDESKPEKELRAVMESMSVHEARRLNAFIEYVKVAAKLTEKEESEEPNQTTGEPTNDPISE